MKTLKSLLAYIGCIVIAAAVAYYIDGTAGIILTTALVFALILSLADTLIVARFVGIDISLSTDLLVKGDETVCSVKLSKKILLPAPIIRVEASCSPHLTLKESKFYSGSIAGKETTEIKIPYTARHFGLAEVRISKVTIDDFLGIFSFKVPIPEERRMIRVSVYPDIPDTGVQIDLLKTASQYSSTDDEEEETEEIAVGSTGMPGYEHRQYYPGDPIKKINWKLSSKRDIYMVRLDEKVSSAGQMFFLDCPKAEEDDYFLSVRDNVAEGALAMLSMLVREGREAEFYFFSDSAWQGVTVRTDADVYLLQEKLADFSPSEPPQLMPPEISASGKTPICFTAATAETDSSAVTIAAQCPDSLIISSAESGLQNISPNFWTVSADYEFTKQAN